MAAHTVNADAEILVKLGIISEGPSTGGGSPRRSFRPSPPQQRPTSGASFEEVRIDDWSPVGSRSISDVSDDEDDEYDVVYDKDSLLNPRTKTRRPYGRRNRIMARDDGVGSLFCKGLLVCAGFFTLGLCLSILGPTLPDIRQKTHADSWVSVAGIVSASGFGALLGITFGSAVYAFANPFFVMGVILCGTAFITLTIPWCTTITGVNLVCFIQGICLGTVERGGYSLFYAYWPKRYSALQLFYVALAFGACVAPLVTTPFVFKHIQPSLNQAVGNHMRHKREFMLVVNESATTIDPAIFTTTIMAGGETKNGTSLDSFSTTTLGVHKPAVAVGAGQPDTIADKNAQRRKEAGDAKKVSPTTTPTVNSSSTTLGNQLTTTATPVVGGGTQLHLNIDTSPDVDSKSEDSPSTTTSTTSTTTTTASTTTSTTTTTTTTTEASTTTASTTTTAPPTTTAAAVAEEATTAAATKAAAGAASGRAPADNSAEKPATTAEKKPTDAGSSETKKVPDTGMGGYWDPDQFWQTVSKRVQDFNNARLAYAIVALISLLSTLLFVVAFACCCIRCRSSRPIDDFAFNPGQLCKIRENRISLMLALVFVLLLASVEANMSNLLTVYALGRQESDDSKSQANGVALTSIFWLGMTTSRVFTAMSGKLLNSTKTLIFLLSVATLAASFLAVFATGSTAVLWMATLMLGTALGPVYPLSFCWLDQRIGLSPWASSLWLIAAAFGRITGPVTTAYMISVDGPRLLLAIVVVGTLLASVTFLFLQKAVKLAGHLRSVEELSRHIKDANGLIENGDVAGGIDSGYTRLGDEVADILEMDDFAFEDENVVHFDRSNDLQKNRKAKVANGGDDGAFSKYRSLK